MILLGLCLLNTIIVFLLLLRTVTFYKLLPRPENYSLPDNELPFVSVIVPARDEEACIGDCLESLALQNYPNFEVLIMDDGSTDGTAAIIKGLADKYPCIKPLKGKGPPPPGWMGKCHALVQAVPEASGQWFVFIDADTVHRPDMLRHSLSYAITKKASMVSFWSKHRLCSFGERLMTPALWSSFQWGDAKMTVNDLKSPLAYGIGHCMLVERTAYLAVGGHGAAREWRIDDHALAMLLKGQGFPILMADGRELLTVRMFTSFEPFWLGWAKQLFAIFRFRLDNMLFHVLYVSCMTIVPLSQIVLLLLLGAGTNSPSPIIEGYLPVLTALVCLQLALVTYWYGKLRSFNDGVHWGYLLLLPLTGVLLVALDFYSALLVITGAELTWKGRSYKITRPKMPPEPVSWETLNR